MIETKFGLKYPFPHTLVHIVDNSSYTGDLPVVVADDPSMYGTIVVTGCPMGEDNRVINVKRSDVLNVAYGLGNLGTSDIRKYGQSVLYPTALINQGGPVKLLRVTPDDATYAYSIITVEWRWDSVQNKMHVRYNQERFDVGRSLADYKNRDRLNAAIVKAFANTETPAPSTDPDGEPWKKRAFIVNISAGRGSAYNKYTTAINQTVQGKRPPNVRYHFTTIDKTNSAVVEEFYASLVNHDNANRADAIDPVNVTIKRRVEGSSIVVPYVNEAAITELYNDYRAKWAEMMENGIYPEDDPVMTEQYVRDASILLNINTFDMIFGNYIHNGTDDGYKLPYFQIDMRSDEVPMLPDSNRIYVRSDNDITDAVNSDTINTKLLENSITGIAKDGDSVYLGDVYLHSGLSSSMANPNLYVVATINQYTGSVTTLKISSLNPKTPGVLREYTSPNQPLGSTTYTSENLPTDSKLSCIISSDYGASKNTFANDLRNKVRKGIVKAGNTIAVLNETGDDFALYYVTETPNTNQTALSLYALAEQGDSGINGSTWSQTYQNYLQRYDINKIYSFINWNSSNMNYGSGAIIATGADDDAWKRIGYVVIDTSAYFSRAVYVNNYNIADAIDEADISAGRLLITKNSRKVGKPPASVSVNADLVNTKYDIITLDEDSFAGYKLNPSKLRITGVELSNLVANGKLDDALTKNIRLAYVTPDGAETVFDLPISGTDTTPRVISAGIHNISVTDLKTLPVELECQATDGDLIPAAETSPMGVFRVVAYGTVDAMSQVTTTDGNEVTVHKNVKTVTVGEGEDAVTTNLSVSAMVLSISADAVVPVQKDNAIPKSIKRYNITGPIGSYWRIQHEKILSVPADYYSSTYGMNITSSDGGVELSDGSTGFFDNYSSDIELKWKYSALLVAAYKGQIDPRIMSPVRVPAKQLFDGGTNTIVGQTILPYLSYTVSEKVNASTIFTEDEREEVELNSGAYTGLNPSDDIDVKQAMYDFMIYRIYQGIPEDMRPIGPGSGLSLYLDAGVTDANTAMLVNTSFMKRFDNPNASWDIGGYVSAADGISYTYTRRLVENLIEHCKTISINKPFTGKYTTIHNEEFVSYFPDIDSTDWELRELLYNSGGNAWLIDINGNLSRRSQRTLHRASDTSDLLQESNMRTLSQLVYLLQNKLDEKLFEYDDDGVLKTIEDECNNMFSGWIGSKVKSLDITLKRDINIDGGEIVVCIVNVVFRGLILRVPIIVNVNGRSGS